MLTLDQIRGLDGSTVYDNTGDKIGKLGQVFLDDQTGEPEWVTINTGLFGTSESFVPLSTATTDANGLRVGYSKDMVKDAPKIDADQHLSPEDEQRLYDYYGVEFSTDTYDTTDTTDTYATTGMAGTTDTYETSEHSTRGHDADDAMTISEERLRVGTERREAGRARLRKYVVTENETITVPVTREEVRIEREPITDANRDRALDGPEITEAEHEVILTEERPVIAKETVPVERVRLEVDQVSEQQTVTDQVRKERLDTDSDNDRL